MGGGRWRVLTLYEGKYVSTCDQLLQIFEFFALSHFLEIIVVLYSILDLTDPGEQNFKEERSQK